MQSVQSVQNATISGTTPVALQLTGNVELTGPTWQAPIYVGAKVRVLFSHDLSLRIEYAMGKADGTPPADDTPANGDAPAVPGFKGHNIPPDTARQNNGARVTLGMPFVLWFRCVGQQGDGKVTFPVTVLDLNPAPTAQPA